MKIFKTDQIWPNMTFYGLKWLHLAWFKQKLVKVRGGPTKSGPHLTNIIQNNLPLFFTIHFGYLTEHFFFLNSFFLYCQLKISRQCSNPRAILYTGRQRVQLANPTREHEPTRRHGSDAARGFGPDGTECITIRWREYDPGADASQCYEYRVC